MRAELSRVEVTGPEALVRAAELAAARPPRHRQDHRQARFKVDESATEISVAAELAEVVGGSAGGVPGHRGLTAPRSRCRSSGACGSTGRTTRRTFWTGRPSEPTTRPAPDDSCAMDAPAPWTLATAPGSARNAGQTVWRKHRSPGRERQVHVVSRDLLRAAAGRQPDRAEITSVDGTARLPDQAPAGTRSSRSHDQRGARWEVLHWAILPCRRRTSPGLVRSAGRREARRHPDTIDELTARSDLVEPTNGIRLTSPRDGPGLRQRLDVEHAGPPWSAISSPRRSPPNGRAVSPWPSAMVSGAASATAHRLADRL